MGVAKASSEVLCWLRKNSGGRKPCLIVMAEWLETLKLRLKICLLLPLRGWHPLTPLPGGETRASVLPRLGVLCPSLVFSWERLIPLLVGGSALSWGLDPVLCQPGTQRPLPTRRFPLTGSCGHLWSYYPRNKLRRRRAREEASAWGGVCWSESKEIRERTRSAPREPRWAECAEREARRGPGPAPVRTSGGARCRGSGQLSLLWSCQPPGTIPGQVPCPPWLGATLTW